MFHWPKTSNCSLCRASNEGDQQSMIAPFMTDFTDELLRLPARQLERRLHLSRMMDFSIRHKLTISVLGWAVQKINSYWPQHLRELNQKTLHLRVPHQSTLKNQPCSSISCMWILFLDLLTWLYKSNWMRHLWLQQPLLSMIIHHPVWPSVLIVKHPQALLVWARSCC